MTALPDWMYGSGEGLRLTAADYEALPEEICRRIEIVDGAVVVSPSPRRDHQDIAHNLVAALKTAAAPTFKAVGDVDLRLRDLPLLNRRSDVVVYDASLPYDEILRPEHCLLVVEIMSGGPITTDRVDKPGEYATAGIRHFWRLENDDQVISVFRYQLDLNAQSYALVGLDKGKLSVKEPVKLELDLAELLY